MGSNGNIADIGTAVAGSKNAVENNRLSTIIIQIAKPSQTIAQPVSMTLVDYLGLTLSQAEVEAVLNSITVEEQIALQSILSDGGFSAQEYVDVLKDKYAGNQTTIAIDPNDLPKLEGIQTPEQDKDVGKLDTPIVDQDKDAGKFVTPIAEQDKNEGTLTGPEIEIGDWRDNVLFAKGKELTENANKLGYGQRIPPQKAPFDSHGQPVYWNGKNYITPDVDGHNTTEGWKMFDRRGNRIGTYDKDLNRIKD